VVVVWWCGGVVVVVLWCGIVVVLSCCRVVVLLCCRVVVSNAISSFFIVLTTCRFRLAFLNSQAAIAVAPLVAGLMAEHLNWDEKEQEQQLADAMVVLNEFGGPVPNKEGAQLSSATVVSLFFVVGIYFLAFVHLFCSFFSFP